MQEEINNFSQDVYYKALEVITNVKFTPREIDVLACMLNGRTSQKAIASFLSISPRTVETHTRNIMNKVGYSSWEGIREFIERSGKSDLLRQHYKELFIQKAFEKCLKEAFPYLKQEAITCEIRFLGQREGESKSFAHKLTQDLKYASIKADIKREERNALGSNSLGSNAKAYILWIVGKEEENIVQNVLKETALTKNNFLLFLEEADLKNLPENLKNISSIDFKNIPYVFAFCDLLKKLTFSSKVKEVLDVFQDSHKGMQADSKVVVISSPGTTPKIGQNKKYILFLIILMALCAGSFAFFLTNSNKTLTAQSAENPYIRADLNIPTDKVFLKRPELIKQIDTKLAGDKGIQTVALMGLVGMGGVGKTTIARAYGKAYQSSLVWELNAETKESLLASFKDLAYALAKTKEQKEGLDFIQKIQDPVEKEKQLLSFIKDHLKNHSHWLLIFDNVENFPVIKQYFPQDAQVWGPGRVIITTRDSTIKNTSYIKQDNIIEIGQLTESEGLTLLSKILYNTEPDKLSKDQREEAIKFLKRIPPFPLDISVAAYYIKDTHSTFDQYLERIQQYSEDFERVQESLLKEATDYTKTRYGVITSSLEKFIQTNREYKELLFFISLLDSQNIPKELLEFYKDPTLVDNFLHDLKKNGLITSENISGKKEEKSSFSLHRSTQAIGLAFLNNLLSQSDQSMYVEKIIESVNTFYERYYEKNYTSIINVISHVELLLSNLKRLNISEDLKEKYKAKLLLILGYSHYKCSHNFKLAKESFSQIFSIKKYPQYISNTELVILLKDMGLIYGDLYDLDNAIYYSKESIKLCELLPNSEILLAGNLKTIAYAYCRKNDFNQSKYFFKEALKKISKLPPTVKKELESDIYAHLASLYSKTLLVKDKSNEALKYALKALEVLDAAKLFAKEKKKEKIPCIVAWHKMTLGQVYNRLGQYESAMEEGFKESEYIMQHSLDNCSHNLLKAYTSLGAGIVYLRVGKIKRAENKLAESILIFEKLIGKTKSLYGKVYRAEARIRLKKYKEAYEDCIAAFQTENKEISNYYILVYLTNYYHAAFIKYKQQDFKKSLEHFNDFFKQMKEFCQEFLEEKEYKELEAKGVFKEINHDNTKDQEKIPQYLKRSLDIFTAIYGPEHPFVKDYILKNYEESTGLRKHVSCIQNIFSQIKEVFYSLSSFLSSSFLSGAYVKS